MDTDTYESLQRDESLFDDVSQSDCSSTTPKTKNQLLMKNYIYSIVTKSYFTYST